MAIKNYVIGAHRRINSPQWAWKDTSAEGDIYETYSEMYRLSRSSLYHFLEGDWEELVWTEDIDNIGQAMKLNWTNVYNLWHREPCNILALGPDVQLVKPLKIFGEFEEFRMFNWTDPKSYSGNDKWGINELPNYFNGDFKYYPHTMSEEVWELGRKMAETWEGNDTTPETWGNEQLIENVMFWSQGLTFEQAHKPELFYQAHALPWVDIEEMNAWNNCDYQDAKVLHWHSSRHSPTKLDCMRQLSEGLAIPTHECKI